MPSDKRISVNFKLDPEPFERLLHTVRQTGRAFRGLSGQMASSRTGYPLLHELDEIEWPFGDRRSYYGEHPYVRAFERRYPRDPLIRGAARVLFAPVQYPVPTKIEDVISSAEWTDLGVTEHMR